MNIEKIKNKDRKKIKKGIFLLPNLFTTGNLFAGCFSIFCAIDGNYQASAIAIFVAVFLDGLDGKIARATNAVSDFGKDYDSLCDLVSFGIAPAIFYYCWVSDNPYNLVTVRITWLISFFYIATIALRLARFNNHLQLKDENHFLGLPSPAAATLCAVIIWQCDLNFIDPILSHIFISMAMLSSSLLMVSNIQYNSFKDTRSLNRIPFSNTLLVPLILILIFLHPSLVLTIMSVTYLFSGPISLIRGLIIKKDKPLMQDPE
ncbi:CDP-diacylglycerol--serine O-phosphatidyltransferase [Gammaproteobacteria bacterium]|nr:CDP-diacylglycerol--serine O-phosphatidyltransferase [Gammaproteobacteria bacterium]